MFLTLLLSVYFTTHYVLTTRHAKKYKKEWASFNAHKFDTTKKAEGYWYTCFRHTFPNQKITMDELIAEQNAAVKKFLEAHPEQKPQQKNASTS